MPSSPASDPGTEIIVPEFSASVSADSGSTRIASIYPEVERVASERMADRLVDLISTKRGMRRGAILGSTFSGDDHEYICTKIRQFADTVPGFRFAGRYGWYLSQIKGRSPYRTYDGKITVKFIENVFNKRIPPR